MAVKGLGGYHLACDARNGEAVAELRRRKGRGGKPFAVMVPDLDVAAGLVVMTGDEERLLAGSRKPIVLLPRRDGSGLSDAVAPGNPDLGLMLAYTPLHVLLFGIGDDEPGPDVLVMTSANLSGEPIITDDEQARTALAEVADAWLRHDREIHVPCDDSVSRFVAGDELPVRRSRGYAPLPLALPFDVPPMLAVGADLKNTCALGEGRLRLGQPAHRRHGQDGHGRGADPHRAAPGAPHRGRAGTTGGRPAPRLPVRRLGPGPRARPLGPYGAAPPRAHRLRDGRTRRSAPTRR